VPWFLIGESMKLFKTFSLRVNTTDIKMIARLAKHYHRSRSDTIRLLIRDAIQRSVSDSEATNKIPMKKMHSEESHE
jgi:hypothetical protein